MNKQEIIIFILFLITITSVSAFSEYPYVGYNNFESDTRGFWTSTSPYNTYAVSLSAPYLSPLSADIDGDGSKELVVADGQSIKSYKTHSLTPFQSVTMAGGRNIDYFILSDIDFNGIDNIIMSNERNISVYEYNGSTIKLNFTYALYNPAPIGETMMACDNVQRCLVIYPDTYQAITAANYIRYSVFDSTGELKNGSVINYKSATSTAAGCLPRIRNIFVDDVDKDGSNNFMFSFINVIYSGVGSATYNYLKVFKTHINSTNSLIIDNNISQSLMAYSSGLPAAGVSLCNLTSLTPNILPQNLGSSPISFDMDGFSDALETDFAYMDSSSTFKQQYCNGALTSCYTRPSALTAQGVMISNPIEMSADYTSSATAKEACVLGYYETDQNIVLHCISLLGSHLQDNFQFSIYMDALTNYYNISYGFSSYDLQDSTLTAVQTSSELDGTKDLSEIVTPFGIFQLDWDVGFCGTGIGYCGMLSSWPSPKNQSSIVMMDMESVGRDDIVALTQSNLYYYDDKYSNTQTNLTRYTIDPCLSSTWQVNTTVQFTVTPTDDDGNDVAAAACLYYGTAYEQCTNWTTFYSSGTEIIFNFVANQTIGTGVLKAFARDSYHNTSNVSISLSYSVGTSGVVQGDCSSSYDYAEAAAANATAAGTLSDEDKSELADDIRELTGLQDNKYNPIVAVILIILALVGVPLALAEYGHIRDGNMLIFAGGFSGIIMWIFACYINMLPYWTLILGVVFTVGAAAIYMMTLGATTPRG